MKKRDKIKELLGEKKDVEVRTKQINYRVNRKTDGSLPKIEGYASVFNKNSEDMGFVERVAPGAFAKALKVSDARALFNHDANYVLGRQSSGTLTLKEDDKGLFMSVSPPDTQIIRDLVLTPIERGDINQQSFGFTIAADEWDGLDSDHPTRTITEVREVFDVSPVTFPAYQDTTVALRSMERAKKKQDEIPEYSLLSVVVDTGLDNEEPLEFSFGSEDEMRKFIEQIKELRSSPKPMLTDDDSAGDEPMLKQSSDDSRSSSKPMLTDDDNSGEKPDDNGDDFLMRIKKLQERYSK